MKKLGKLSINPEKVIKNEELENLRGGYLGCFKCCWNGTTNCSDCYHSYSTADCTEGAELVECDNSETCYYHG